MKRNTKLTADESADLLRLSLKAEVPFFFTKYGDGAIECINAIGFRTCDHERYSPELAAEINRSFELLRGCERLYLADWLSAWFDAKGTGRYEDLYMQFVDDASPIWLNYEAILLDRESTALVEFYRAVKLDSRRKVIMGPAEWAPAVTMLGASRHIVTPMGGVLPNIERLRDEIEESEVEILLYGAGIAGTVPVIDHWFGGGDVGRVTYINLGSAIDPLFRTQSRRRQLAPQRARHLMRGLLK